MPELTPEEKERIYLEEKARREAQKRLLIEEQQNIQVAQKLKSQKKRSGCLMNVVYCCIGLSIITFSRLSPFLLFGLVAYILRKKLHWSRKVAFGLAFLLFIIWGTFISLVPDELRPQMGSSTVQAPQQKEPLVIPAPRFKKEIFYLKDNERRYSSLIVAGAMQIHDPSCPELAYAALSEERSTQDEPVFFYTCYDPSTKDTFNIWKSKSNIESAARGNH
jgi:hypothetical protein